MYKGPVGKNNGGGLKVEGGSWIGWGRVMQGT